MNDTESIYDIAVQLQLPRLRELAERRRNSAASKSAEKRALSVAITKLEEVEMWLDKANRS